MQRYMRAKVGGELAVRVSACVEEETLAVREVSGNCSRVIHARCPCMILDLVQGSHRGLDLLGMMKTD